MMDKTILDSVLQLEPHQRMRLLEVIYESLEEPDAGVDAAWYDEAQRRLAAYKAGEVQGLPAEDVLGDRP